MFIVKRGFLKNGIYIVATPIGNLKDISLRAMETLREADIIACEDTRVTKKLFNLLGLCTNKNFIRLDDNSEVKQSETIISLIKSGKSIALVSDAGSPLISDPGYKIINKCRKEGIDIYTIPGACAVICALQLSGLPTNRFMFAGFVPNKEKARKDTFVKLKNIDSTLVFYETANRILKTLKVIDEVFETREVAVAREITKIYEECVSGCAKKLLAYFSEHEPKGEMVLIIAPPTSGDIVENIDIDFLLRQELQKTTLKSAVKNISDKYDLCKNDVYQRALKIKDE